MSAPAVLFDVPGPKARTRNGLLGVVAVLVVVAILGFIVYRLSVTGQFDGAVWEWILYENIQLALLEGLVNTLRAFALGAVLALAFGALFALGRLSDKSWLRGVQMEVVDGLVATLKAAGIAAVLALIFGAVFASGRLSDRRILRVPSTSVVELFRAIPLLILIFFGYYVPLQYGWSISNLWALVIGLTLYNGSVLAEIFRSGVLAVPRGQSEAAYALGLRKSQVMTSVLLPQSLR
jgi:glutamate transport system permease protein